MTDTITMLPGSGLHVGERITLSGKPNSMRYRVAKVLDCTSFELATYRRPSRGYARHLRKMKRQ